ncbi:hypothetical protein J3R30DRAFT_1471827 [Lentinula aciculospora]|uniref:Uncharacterized protein n=1 Tax=Lentinula aciculospora TaxID=153920 RepID=A0A9W9AM53_9AGAR|nr:hypothetical protein J3R30DRAFT_1471827 [Lentinula aciculospora]
MSLSSRVRIATVCIVIIASVALLWRYYHRHGRRNKASHNDPYGLFHLSLNKRPGEEQHGPPKTEWLNMGYWKVNIANGKPGSSFVDYWMCRIQMSFRTRVKASQI